MDCCHVLHHNAHLCVKIQDFFWEWSPLIHKKGFHVKVSPGKSTKAESSAWCCPKSDNSVEELYALLSVC